VAERGRRLFAFVFGGASAALAALYAVPGLRYLIGVRTHDDDATVDAGVLAELPEGVPHRAAVTLRGADAWSVAGARVALYLVRSGEQVSAFDAACPHTGCAVDWSADSQAFRCPCHRSQFSVAGARLAGPAPRGLDPQAVEVRDGRVLVRYRRFRAGRTDRVPV
jgi:Rieske Fe-S protein